MESRKERFFNFIDDKILFETIMGKVAKSNFDNNYNTNVSNSDTNVNSDVSNLTNNVAKSFVFQTPTSSKMNDYSSINSSLYTDNENPLLHSPTFSKMKKKKLFHPRTIDEDNCLSDKETSLPHIGNDLSDMASYPDGNITYTLVKVTNNSGRRVVPAFGWKLMTNNQKKLKSSGFIRSYKFCLGVYCCQHCSFTQAPKIPVKKKQIHNINLRNRKDIVLYIVVEN